MPKKYARNKRPYRRNRKPYKKLSPYKQKTKVPVSLGLGFPTKLMMTHKYADAITLTSTSGSIATYLWSTNGLYDPDYTATGHQPMGFDNLTPLYNWYVVIASKIKLIFTQDDIGNNPISVSLFINDNTATTSQSPWLQAEQSNKGQFRTIPAGAVTNHYIVQKWSAKRAFGKGLLANNELQGSSTANPSQQQYFTVSMRPLDGVSSAIVRVQVLIEYVAIWKELSDQPAQ